MSPELWEFLKWSIPQVGLAVGVYAGIRADLKVMKFKVNQLWSKVYDTRVPPDTF
jgi:hypothetical protein